MGENLCVSHSEYITDITGSTAAFNVANSFVLNPGMEVSFPWLNQIASRYESYKFMKLNFRFVTERPTTESGYIALVPDYDPTDPQPLNKSNAFQYESTAKCAPWENLLQINSPGNLSRRKTYFVRQGPLSATETLGLYDAGNLFVCVGGNSGAVTLGELWCDYEVCFYTPQIDSNVSSTDNLKLVGATAQTGALPFGTGGVVTQSRYAFATYNGATGALTFQAAYQGSVTITFIGTTLAAATINTGTTAVSTIFDYQDTNTAGTNSITYFDVQATPGQTLIVSISAATVSSAILRLSPYPVSLG